MKQLGKRSIRVVEIAMALLVCGCQVVHGGGGVSTEIPILRTWQGDFPVLEYRRLPVDQRAAPNGYLGDAQAFSAVWQVFQPGDPVPEVDFDRQLALFARNVRFYNRLGIARVVLSDGVAAVLVTETMSALPIGEVAAMAMAVIPRHGVRAIAAGDKLIPVADAASFGGTDPSNASYTVSEWTVSLQDGRWEQSAAPGSAAKDRVSAFGAPVFGDLDGDGDEDAALFLSLDSGGSGTFYFAAAALNRDGRYRGTPAVLLGDRIAPRSLEIRGGLVLARYLDRNPQEAMSAEPTVARALSLSLKGGELQVVQPLGADEQVVEGWVTLGHEVRSFQPCSSPVDHWISGSSSALKEIQSRYAEAAHSETPYVALFMVLAGATAEAPADGFGADYPAAFVASQVVAVRPRGSCRSEVIVVDSPVPGASIRSPLAIRGRARGSWFFEGDFPVVLRDHAGTVVAAGFVTATGEWMTDRFVPFEGTLSFKPPPGGDRGLLVFRKDNPSDRAERDDEMALPVFLE